MTTAVLEIPMISDEEARVMFSQPPKSKVNWALYEFAYTGISELMTDRMTQEQVLGLITGQKVEYPKDEPLENKARRKLYAAT